MSIPEHISEILPRVLAGLPGGGMSALQPWQKEFLRLLEEKRDMVLVQGRKGMVWIPKRRKP